MPWRYQDFEIDEIRFELRRTGERIAIAPLPLALLIHLAKRHPATVSRQELLAALWPGVRVTSDSVSQTVLLARRALDEERNGESVIRTIRGRGYALGVALEPIPSSAPSRASFGSDPFIGRDTELVLLDAALDRVDAGDGRILFISGEPGIGKTRLLDQLTKRAGARGALVATGQCREDEGAPPYWPWPEIFASLRAQREDPEIHNSVDLVLEDIATADALKSAKDSPHAGLSDADARFRLFLNTTECLQQVARKDKLVVLLEDLHWASPGALNLLRFAALSLSRAPVLVAVTYRTSGPPLSATLQKMLGELAASTHAIPQMELPGFSNEEVAAYVSSLTGQTPNKDVVARLRQAGGANPLFLRELVAVVGVSNPAGSVERTVSIPSSLMQIICSRSDRLRDSARRLVETASVVGRTFSAEILARVTRRKVEAVLEDLDEARGEGVIESHQDGLFRFRHDVIRAALFERLRPARRIDLHLRIANAIEQSGDGEAHSAELAHHFFEAITRNGVGKAVHYATKAAESARDALDFDAAAQSYRLALSALERQTSPPPTQRCDLLFNLGEVLELTGQFVESREAILFSADLARTLRSYRRLGDAALASTRWTYGLVADAATVELVESALRAVGRRQIGLRARLLGKLAVLRRMQEDETESFRLLDEALALAENLRDTPLQCDVLLHRLLVMQWGIPGDHAERLSFTSELLTLADRVGHRYATLWCRRLRAALFLDSGAGAELDEEILHYERASTAAGRCKQHLVVAHRAMRAIVSGRFAEAVEAIDESERLADPRSLEESRFTPISQRISLPPEYRDSEALLRSIQDQLREYPRVIEWRAAHGLIALDLGRTEQARAALDQLAADDFALVPRNLNYVLIPAVMTAISWRLRDDRFARRLHELLSPHVGAQVTTGVGSVYLGPVDWYLGVLCVMMSRPVEAASHFEVALTTTERLAAWPWHAQTQFEYAALLASGDNAEHIRASDLAEAARDGASRFRMLGLEAEAARLVAALGSNYRRSS